MLANNTSPDEIQHSVASILSTLHVDDLMSRIFNSR